MSEDKKTILVVDDEEDVVTYLTALFEDNGFAVVSCGTGGEAIEKTNAIKPDLITLDIAMPEESGVRAYKTIRASDDTKDIPVVMITGYEDPHFKKFIHTRRTAPPPDAYFEKPIDRDALIKKVKELLGV